jgi:dTDP-glucose pyrophosphorylase
MNVVIPMVGKSPFFEDASFGYPKPLVEINGSTMIELVINNLHTVCEYSDLIFILNEEDCAKYFLDNTIRILTNNQAKIIKVSEQTKGAACTAMLAVQFIDNDENLLIVNYDQIFSDGLHQAIKSFKENNADSGVVTFKSVHPKWSYAKVLGDLVIEVAEKRPISNAAIAGLYFFKKGSDFLYASKKMIAKDANVNGVFYVAPSLNELILEGKKVLNYSIDIGSYHSFYSKAKIDQFESLLKD